MDPRPQVILHPYSLGGLASAANAIQLQSAAIERLGWYASGDWSRRSIGWAGSWMREELVSWF
jgi:hypothetical protein